MNNSIGCAALVIGAAANLAFWGLLVAAAAYIVKLVLGL